MGTGPPVWRADRYARKRWDSREHTTGVLCGSLTIREEKIMTAKTAKADPALKLAHQLVTSRGDVKAALALAEKGAQLYPSYRLPVKGDGPNPSFAEIAAGLRGQVQTPASGDESAPKKAAPRKATARKAAPKVAEPVPVAEPTVLKIVHDGVSQTTIYGVEKGSEAQLAIGSKRNGGLGWSFWLSGKVFYLQKSQGYAPDMDKINEAVARLESIKGDNGEQLYRVDTAITTTDAAGNPLPKRLSFDELNRWQREYTARQNALYAEMGLRRGVCGGCGATGLDHNSGRISKGDDGMPMINCATCGGFSAPEPVKVAEPAPAAEPTVDLSALVLALPAAEQRENCHKCKTDVAVVDGEYVLHSTPQGSACRARRGVQAQDVAAEPAPEKPRKATVKATAVDSIDDLDFRFALQAGLSKKAAGDLATDLRSALSRQITYGKASAGHGVKFSVFRDKVESKFVRIEIVEGGEHADVAKLAAEIDRVARSVRGIRNRIHKAETVAA